MAMLGSLLDKKLITDYGWLKLKIFGQCVLRRWQRGVLDFNGERTKLELIFESKMTVLCAQKKYLHFHFLS